MSGPRLGEDFVRRAFPGLEPVVVLGRGGFGEVWRVRTAAGDRVLKLLAPDAPVRRWRREVDAHDRVRSARIPRMLDHGEVPHDDGTVRWLTLEYVEGPTVRTRMREEAWPAPSSLASFGRGVLEAVRDVHAAGLVFRDVSPGNVVLVDGSWSRPRLVDLGLAVAVDAPERSRSKRAGTKAYKAPEQLRKDPVTPATDLFGVGVVCYKLAAGGAHPFLAAGEKLSASEAQDRIAGGPRPLPAEHAVNERWIRRLLAFEPEERWLDDG